MGMQINEDFCKGCGFCIEFCPEDVYELSDRLNRKGYQLPAIVNPENCTDCGLCELYCPEFALVPDETALAKKKTKKSR